MVERETGFDSRTDLCVTEKHKTFGLLVQREDAWFAPRRSGFNSPAVH
jgi:hypothetical protein